ncbi:DUF11 domain-containing protein [Paenibacillus rhizoplanae]
MTTPVFQPIIAAAKSSSSVNATVGDTITYTVNVTNSGNYAATATLTDTIPAGTTLVPNSVLIGGFPAPGADPCLRCPAGLGRCGCHTANRVLCCHRYTSCQPAAQQPGDHRLCLHTAGRTDLQPVGQLEHQSDYRILAQCTGCQKLYSNRCSRGRYRSIQHKRYQQRHSADQ